MTLRSSEMDSPEELCTFTGVYNFLLERFAELRSASCHMESHSVTCHLIRERALFNPSETGWYSIYLARRDGRLS